MKAQQETELLKLAISLSDQMHELRDVIKNWKDFDQQVYYAASHEFVSLAGTNICQRCRHNKEHWSHGSNRET